MMTLSAERQRAEETHTLQLENHMLSERLHEQNALIADLRDRLQQRRQAKHDAIDHLEQVMRDYSRQQGKVGADHVVFENSNPSSGRESPGYCADENAFLNYEVNP